MADNLASPCRLIEVYKKLRAIGAAASNYDVKEQLLNDAKHIVQDICSDHVAAADSFIRDPELGALLKADTEMECQLLVDYLGAAKRFNLEINSRAKDRVVSFGEKLSCRFMTCLLKDRVSLSSPPFRPRWILSG
jgi:aspartate kinase